ncbi:unnamed protein product [Pieris macdunnoughi]|uniref:ATPase AAA-type core domain-containing protein n=1 Tax=Pieris macdunnoughi TaxID=345717 RepID=A0A821UC49_9NEOP|nr:unnamed protein product [Pieris macdunnoughi]
MSLKCPSTLPIVLDAHKKWLKTLHDAQTLIENDMDLQEKAAQGLWLKERRVPPEVLGTMYSEYCSLINRMYDAYLNSTHLQRAPYIKPLISVFMKRMYELRNELVHLIVNDYIYVDDGLIQTRRTPFDIQIIIPYHLPLECREDSMEHLLQKMWADSIARKNAPPPKKVQSQNVFDDDIGFPAPVHQFVSVEQFVKEVSEHTIYSEEYLQAIVIQRQERFRQYFNEDFKAKCRRKRMYFADNVREAPLYLRRQAAMLIQKVYRRYMQVKRQRVVDTKRDVLLGLIPDPFRKGLSYEEENNKMYLRKRNLRTKLKETYKMAFEKENTRLVVFKKDDQIDDITDHVRTWFREWFYGYGFFPEYPYEIEGGTVMVIRGQYPTIQEKKEDDERYLATMKGKTKEMLKAEAKQAKLDAIQKELAAKEQKKREEEQLFRLRCNPLSDPGYQPQTSQVMGDIVEVLQKYQAAWSIYDEFPPDKCPEAFFGYMQEILTEDLMGQIHLDCRKYVDELMRLDLKLLIKAHQEMYKSVGWKFPKMPTRKKPKAPPVPKPLKINDGVLESFHQIFDLGLVSKPTNKIKEIIGDLNYYAYDVNIRDPDAKFPPPSYGDIRRRLTLSCVYGSGIEPGATRNKAVMLLGPQRNGKSFLVDTVCGELNAVKIDITPEVFSAHVDKPAKALTEVFLAAKVFQPTVIYMRNIERVFCKKVAPEDKYLQAKAMAVPLNKLIKQMIPDDKIIFIATCSSPLIAQTKPMVSLFNEIILVPRTDYNSLRTFFCDRLQMIRSMPRDYCVQALAQVLQGYGFGVIVEVFNRVLTPERIVRLNVTPLTPAEFLDPIFQIGLEATTMEEYQEFVDFYIANSPLSIERPQFEKINSIRALLYGKLAKKTKS